jgi:GT2 family glycosyltransferase
MDALLNPQIAQEARPGTVTPRIAVLCVTHGRPELVKKCLLSCAKQNYLNFEIVVIVNPADDKTEQAVREAAPSANVIRTHRNLGFFPALNIALANTEAEYVMIVDDDAWFLQDDALSRLLEEFRRMPSLGAVTCNLEGPCETPISGGDRFIRVFTTGFTMMPRKVVTEWVSYFPDLFFRSAGETFLCTLLWEQGRPIKRIENVRMYHALAQVGRSTRDWYFHAIRSQVLCAIMREPASWLLPVLFSKFVKTFVFAVRKNSLGIWFHAWMSSLFLSGEALQFRKPVSASTRRLLAALDRAPVMDLTQCPEWKQRNPGQNATS